jgi:glycosyltransferase involved in cell wall biosynthesis
MKNEGRVDISFLMSSIKRYEDFGINFVSSIYELAKESKYTFEIIISHPNKIDDDRVVWLEEKENFGQEVAFNNCAKISKGDYLFICVDDHIATGDIFGVIDFLNSDLFKDRKYKITTLAGGMTDDITFVEHSPSHPHLLDEENIFNMPRFHVTPFPVVERSTYENLLGGHIMHPKLWSMADWYLGAFLYYNGEQAIQYNGAKYHRLPNDPMTAQSELKDFSITYNSIYKLIKNYKKGMDYVYGIECDIYKPKNV